MRSGQTNTEAAGVLIYFLPGNSALDLAVRGNNPGFVEALLKRGILN